MKKEFVSYQLAVKLKQLGFDEPCIYHFKKNNEGENSFIFTFEMTTPFGKNHNILESRISSPLFQQAFRWFREKYEIYYTIEGSKKFGFQHFIYDEKGSYEIKSEEIFKNYEEAESACLTKLIEIVEQQKQK